MTASALLDRLSGVVRRGEGKWICKCPAHNDRGPSLSVRELPDGRVLVHCFAGCETSEVLASVGLTFGDVMPETCGEFKPERNAHGLSSRDALRMLQRESVILLMMGRALLSGEEWGEGDQARLRLLVERAAQIADIAGG